MKALDTINLKRLRTLRAIVDTGSLVGAADRVHLTAPAIHTQLRMLEEALGCKLVQRGAGMQARLTAEGHLLCSAQATIDAVLGKTLGEIRALQKGQRGRVCLGAVSTGKYFVPNLVASINRAFPDIDLVLRIGNRNEMLVMIQRGEVDMVIMGRPPRMPPVIARPLGPNPHVMIAPPDHRLVGRQDITPEELLAETFIVREPGSGTRILMTRFLDRIGDGFPYHSIEMESNETIKQAVIAELGIALISQHTVIEELRGGRLAMIDYMDLPIRRHWFLLHEENSLPKGAGETIFNFILAREGDFLPGLKSETQFRQAVSATEGG